MKQIQKSLIPILILLSLTSINTQDIFEYQGNTYYPIIQANDDNSQHVIPKINGSSSNKVSFVPYFYSSQSIVFKNCEFSALNFDNCTSQTDKKSTIIAPFWSVSGTECIVDLDLGLIISDKSFETVITTQCNTTAESLPNQDLQQETGLLGLGVSDDNSGNQLNSSNFTVWMGSFNGAAGWIVNGFDNGFVSGDIDEASKYNTTNEWSFEISSISVGDKVVEKTKRKVHMDFSEIEISMPEALAESIIDEIQNQTDATCTKVATVFKCPQKIKDKLPIIKLDSLELIPDDYTSVWDDDNFSILLDRTVLEQNAEDRDEASASPRGVNKGFEDDIVIGQTFFRKYGVNFKTEPQPNIIIFEQNVDYKPYDRDESPSSLKKVLFAIGGMAVVAICFVLFNRFCCKKNNNNNNNRQQDEYRQQLNP